MAITDVKEINEARGGGIDREWKRTYTRSWRILTDDPSDGTMAVLRACPVGLANNYDDGVDVDTGAFVNDIQAKCIDEDKKGWVVTVQYGPYDPEINPASPLDRALQISWGGAAFEEIADWDKDGNPIVNSAGDSPDPQITRDNTRTVLTIVRCEALIDIDLIEQYRDAVSSDIFLGRDPGFWKCASISPVLKKDQDIGDYWEVTYEFHGNRDGWVKKILDQGFRFLSGTAPNQKREPILVKSAPATTPVMLDGEGGVLPVGEEPVTLEFHVQPELPFSVFNINLTDIPALAS